MHKTSSRRRYSISLRLASFSLPPVKSALVVGRAAHIGARALFKALQEISPGQFELLELEHADFQALIVNRAYLRRVPRELLERVLVDEAEGMMDATETLHVDLEVEVFARHELSASEGRED